MKYFKVNRLFKSITDFFFAEKTEYWHRDRSIEVVALEKGVDINSLSAEIKVTIELEGRVEAIKKLRHRFHVPLSSAWRFVNKIDNKQSD